MNVKANNVDVVCLGELLVDMFPAEQGKRLAEVSAFRPKPGGAPANVAVSLARLGVNSAFIGKVGDDAFGHHLAQVMVAEGVETRGMRFDDDARTTLAFIASPDPHTAEFLFYRNPGADTRLRVDELDIELLASAKAFHFGSLSLAEDPIREAVTEAIKTVAGAKGMISFDVNYRPTLWSRPETAYEQVMAVMPQVNLLKVNEVELELLTGVKDPEVGSGQLLELGPEICVITAGASGSYFRVANGFGYVEAFPVETIDATGCGDAFVAGLLSRLISLGNWRDQASGEAMRINLTYANGVGALTAQKQGVIPALPTADAVADFLAIQPNWRKTYD
jgi:fructokinase